ncbi:HAMP domain-containing sensor histidine kinase [Phyllobacterium sp. SB3]|uniref:sensor histidine kinase n=1 Tax=Phyllobacterium sp. SB3 TaxID=3156073 RepID=UPI0032AEC133
MATLFSLALIGVVVRKILQPFSDLATAASRFGIDGGIQRRLTTSGPYGASMAARALNAMSERVKRQGEERIRVLTAFSHDLQTPITRMQLRVELAKQIPERDKLLRDLREVECLARDGIAYARDSHVTCEDSCSVDLRVFIEGIVCDYEDTGRDVFINGVIQGVWTVKPAALRRILSNFIDNALKFGGGAQISVSRNIARELVIAVMDRGPGIAPAKLCVAMKPFVKLHECSGGPVTGFGLGLAICQQLAREMNASVLLENRVSGGLSAQIVFALQ